MDINKIGVVGCGTMGAGIAQVCAHSGYRVVVSDKSQSILNKGLNSINSSLTKGVEKGKLSDHEKEIVLGRIKVTINISDLRDCDLLIEAVAENMDLKKKIFTELDRICPKHAILTTNTSSLSVTDIAMATGKPEKVLGLHFFNPAPVMALLEIVPTIMTDEDTIKIVEAFCKSLGKTAVISKDTPGFIVNRLTMPFILNAIRMLENGVATRDDIDNSVKLGLNHPIGPLALADLIGLDVICFIVDSVYQQTKDIQYASPNLLRKMIAARWLGQKNGKGFYEYRKTIIDKDLKHV